jgi:hypothetical protein
MDKNLLAERISRLREWNQPESLNTILFDTFSNLMEYNQNSFD